MLALATKEKNRQLVLGGMINKLHFANMAEPRIKVVIFRLKEKYVITKQQKVKNLRCTSQKVFLKNARQNGLASGSIIIGSLTVDDGDI